jgi:hypothetical protein
LTHNRSSSNRTSSISDAVIVRGDQSLGPLRLPFRRAEDFVAHFNRTYVGLGIEVIENCETEPESARLDASAKDSRLSEKPKSQLEEPESGAGP